MEDEGAASVYSPGNIKELKSAEHIRIRPGMYVGDTGFLGLHHIAYELIYNSVNEALAGHCRNIHVTLNANGSFSVSEDGRGIPVEIHPQTGMSILELLMTRVGADAKFDKGVYKVAASLHGMGAKVVTALSEWAEVQVQRMGRTYVQEYERGKTITPVKDVGPSSCTGTRVTFKPDPQIFSCLQFSFSQLRVRLEELAMHLPSVSVVLTDNRGDPAVQETIHFPNGLADRVALFGRGWPRVHASLLHGTAEEPGMKATIAFGWHGMDKEHLWSFCNTSPTIEGGTHVTGFHSGLTQSLRSALPILRTASVRRSSIEGQYPPTEEDLRVGLVAIIAVELLEPRYEGSRKVRLNYPEVERLTSRLTQRLVEAFVREHPDEAQAVVEHLLKPTSGKVL